MAQKMLRALTTMPQAAVRQMEAVVQGLSSRPVNSQCSWSHSPARHEVVVELAFGHVAAAFVLLVPRHGQSGTADGGEQAAEGLELIFVVASVAEALVEGEQPLVEDGEVGQEVA
ncbi:hypothetical protein ACIRH0_44455 [Streptomyces sp. NPDC093675]|uniref:hypothetical protein n=1 Tax=Streptomyces sp. NPDC093675 TaxID=3366049 RepID=UPI0037FCABF8